MKKAATWVKSHPILTVVSLLGVVILYYVIKSVAGSGSGGASTTVVTPASSGGASGSTTAAQVANNQTAAALDAHQSDNDTKLALGALGAGVANNQTSSQERVNLQSILTAGQVAGINANAGVSIANINANASIQNTTTQTQGAVDITGLNTGRDIAVSGLAADVAKYQTSAAVNENSTNQAAQITLAGIAADTSRHQTDVAGAVAFGAQGVQRDYIDTGGNVAMANIGAAHDIAAQQIIAAHDIASKQIASQNNEFTQISDALNAGVYNKGGEGGRNMVSVVTALTNQPSVGVAAQVGETQSNVSNSAPAIISASGSVAGKILGSIFG